VIERGAAALVVAPPGRLRTGWRALLLATPQISEAWEVTATLSVQSEVVALDPDIVLVDADAFGETTWTLLDQIRERWPVCRNIVLVCSAQKRQEALGTGVDAVLVKGFRAAELSAVVDRLLSPWPGDERQVAKDT